MSLGYENRDFYNTLKIEYNCDTCDRHNTCPFAGYVEEVRKKSGVQAELPYAMANRFVCLNWHKK